MLTEDVQDRFSMKEIDLAYAAGLMDGEGSVLLMRDRASAEFKRPHICITSTTRNLVDFMQEVFGGYIVVKTPKIMTHKVAFEWRASYNAALKILSVLLPYMKEDNKIKRAEFLLQNYKRLTNRNGKYSQKEKVLKISFEKRFASL